MRDRVCIHEFPFFHIISFASVVEIVKHYFQTSLTRLKLPVMINQVTFKPDLMTIRYFHQSLFNPMPVIKHYFPIPCLLMLAFVIEHYLLPC